ncbi:MAG: heat-inducible transcriptional repressor HrcA [Clostridia bacterium]|nr:heat-inducible transcriptional repressor HrcA [Clostridia bacterium]
MDERKHRILMAIIDDYISTAMPVGSRTISKKLDSGGLSSATIRNEMSDLEELGYLEQPHTSSGRIPSDKAYRLYVDGLLRGVNKLPAGEVKRLRTHFHHRARQVEDIIASAAHAISDVTRYTAMVTLPQSDTIRIRHVQLVPVSENSVLLVVVTNLGLVRDTVIQGGGALSADQLHALSRILTENLVGLPPSRVRDKLAEISGAFGMHHHMVDGVLTAVEGKDAKDVMIGGRSNILNYPEYSDTEKARAMLAVLETRDKLLQLMRAMQDGSNMSFTIRIGGETGLPETSESSVVSMTYRIGDDTSGSIGVIGPTRMQYAKVLPVLDYMGKALGQLLSEVGSSPLGKKDENGNNR